MTDGRSSPVAHEADRSGDPGRDLHRWVLFGAMCGIYLVFGMVLLAIPPMVAQVRADLGISRGMLGFALGAWALLYIFTAPPMGRIIDRLGLRLSLTAGSLLIAVSALTQACAQGVVMLWLAIGIIGIGGPLVSLSAPKLVAVWFANPRDRALAVGLYTSAPAIGGMLALALTNSVLLPALGDWRWVLVFDATLTLLAASAWVLVSRSSSVPGTAHRSEVPTLRGAEEARVLLGSSGVRLAMLLGIGTFFITQGLSAWLPDMLEEDAGLSARTASNWAAASLAVGIAARLVMPGLAGPARRSGMLHGVMVALGLAMVLMAVGSPGTQVVAALVLGLRSALSALVILVLMETEQVTVGNVGLAYGLWFSAVQIGGAVGPQVVGAFGDSGLGFPGALVAMAILLVLMVAVLCRHDRRNRRLAGRSPSGPPTTTAGSTMCAAP
jgi:predicted MFS family arabinose efflux permease